MRDWKQQRRGRADDLRAEVPVFVSAPKPQLLHSEFSREVCAVVPGFGAPNPSLERKERIPKKPV